MGVLDNLGGLLSGSGRTTVPVPALPNEVEILRVNATRMAGGLTAVGGELVLTDQRIYFTPWNTKDIAAIESWVLPKVGAPKIAGQAVGLAQRGVDGAAGEFARGATTVAAGSGTRPPTVRVTSGDRAVEYGVLAGGVWTPNWSRENVAKRDEFLRAANS
jgi:hypothetical protein